MRDRAPPTWESPAEGAVRWREAAVAKERLVGQSTFINRTQPNPLKNYDKSGHFWQIWQGALLSANRHFRCIELVSSDQVYCTTNRARRGCQLTPRTDGPFLR
jgi:hypothetical protein